MTNSRPVHSMMLSSHLFFCLPCLLPLLTVSWKVFLPDLTQKAKENWIEVQCSEIEESLRKNNSKRAHQLVQDLTTVKQGKATTVQDRSEKCLTEEQEILNQWTEYCTELFNHKATRLMEIHQYWTVPRQTHMMMTTPSFAKKWRLQYNH